MTDAPDPDAEARRKLVANERAKLLATALNTMASSCFTVGIATPVAGYIYNVSNLQSALSIVVLSVGVVGWLVAATCLHLLARRVLKELRP